ncbi:four helix bundle protein [Mangrovivirga cuniculi]
MNYKGFEDLECWKKGYSFKVFLRQEILKNFPADEKYLLTSQLIRAARSYNANIAEGWGVSL